MTEKGVVIKTDGQFATVRINKKPECEGCGMCLFPQGVSHVDITCKNQMGAKEGQTVTLTGKNKGKLTSVSLVFGVPLLMIILGIVLGFTIKINEIIILAFSVLFIVLWYTILALIDKKLKNHKSFLHEIVEIEGEKDE